MSGGGGLGAGLSSASDAEALLGLPALSAASGASSATDWTKIANVLKGAGGLAQPAVDDSRFDRIAAQAAPVEAGGQGLPNLLATLIQMHRNAIVSQSGGAVMPQSRASLLG